MDAPAIWTTRGAVTAWPARRSAHSIGNFFRSPGSLPSRPTLPLGWAAVSTRIRHWWRADLEDEGRDMTLLGGLMGFVALVLVATSVLMVKPAAPYETQLERQHAEWERSQQDAVPVAEVIVAR